VLQTVRSAFCRTETPRPRADDQHASRGRFARRRYCAPFHLACSATLASTSTSTPAELDRFALTPQDLGAPARDASGRLLQPTFQRRAPELGLVSSVEHAGDPSDFTPLEPLRPAASHNGSSYSLQPTRERRSSDVPVVRRTPAQAPNKPPNQDPFHPRPVKIASFPWPGTPSTSRQPFPGRSPHHPDRWSESSRLFAR